MLFRIVFALGAFALGYYVGREIGRSDSIREELRAKREQDVDDNDEYDSEADEN